MVLFATECFMMWYLQSYLQRRLHQYLCSLFANIDANYDAVGALLMYRREETAIRVYLGSDPIGEASILIF